MFAISPFLKHKQKIGDRYLLHESEDRRTRIFGTILCEVGFSLFGRTGYSTLKFHLFHPEVSTKMWRMLIRARETAEEYAGFYVSDYDYFIQAQITLLAQESLKGMWTQLTKNPIQTPHKLVLMLLMCNGAAAGYRFLQYQSEQYNPEVEKSNEKEVDYHNTMLLEHLISRWHLPIHTIILQTYRSGIFTSEWIQQHPTFKKLVGQGLAESVFINDYLKTKESPTPCPKSRRKSPSPQKQNSHSLRGSNGGYSGRL